MNAFNKCLQFLKNRKLFVLNARKFSMVEPKKFIYQGIFTSICIFSIGGWYYIYFNAQKNREWPKYSVREVSCHNNRKNGIWVTYQGGVYDITKFVDDHPGGDIILSAAGSAVDPYWTTYAVHKQPDIRTMLEKFRIGSILDTQEENDYDPYCYEPENRSSVLKINAAKPFNAEPPLPMLVKNFVTPSNVFYVRNHLPVPDVKEYDYELEIEGLGVNSTILTLENIKKKFPKVTVMATIQCAGNRRSEMSKIKPVKGLSWDAGAIGNAKWSGVRLIDVLTYCGFQNADNIKHVQFEGLDTDPTNAVYGASIPIQKAVDPRGDVILAYEMNGLPLDRDRGYPLRVIVPGVVGARNVKWLSKIIISDEESSSHWQRNDYKGFSPSVDWQNVDFKSAPAIQELPVMSAICSPLNGDHVQVQDGKLNVSGYAWSGGGKEIIRVDVTANRGGTWHTAILQKEYGIQSGRCWSWSLWSIDVPVDISDPNVEIWVKAVDSSYNTQPESFENIWNLRGVLANAYHKIVVIPK